MSVSVRTALQLMIDTFGAEPDGCLECSWDEGSAGVMADGTPCELCGPQRQAIVVAIGAMGRPDVLHELLDECKKALAAWHGSGPPIDLQNLAAVIASAEGRS